jgi:CII-binding regulator of phage lambda lysogenization HflD
MESFTSKNVPEMVLEKTLNDLQIRSEVEATMQDMLVDVEVTASLQREVDTQSQLSALQAQVSQYEAALQEIQAVQSHQRQEQGSLADSLVQQLWTLSQELGQLRRWKETHETTVMEHDETIAKLLQAEEQIRVLEARPPAASPDGQSADFGLKESPAAPIAVVVSEPSTVKETPTTLEKTSSEQPTMEESPATATAPQQNGTKANDAVAKETESIEKEVDALLALADHNALAEGLLSEQTVPANVVTEASPADNALGESGNDNNAVVALLEDEENDEVPTLDTLNMKVLTEIFEFLDAVEILNTAQINITMFSRVDALFGFSDAEQGEQPPAAAAAEAPPAVISTTATIAALPPSAPAALGRAPLASPTGPADAKMPAQPVSSSPPAAAAAAGVNAPRRGGIFSLLQARGSGGLVARRGAAAGTSDQPLTAAMTDSMVSKLNDKELSAIFSLTEKLHQREKAVATLTAEKEELAGKLDGTEALKEFLISKVRDVEQSLHKSQEDEMKVAQQISSDQEVIAFLDGRVQQLERDIKSLSDEKKNIAEKMSNLQTQNDKKIEVLGDMLQFERERVSENEREWKATKKLLVKEIKSCRAQLLALQAERDGFREQNERLKKAVLLTNPSSGSM